MKLLVVMGLIGFAPYLMAAETESKTSADLDKVIHDSKMRAESGSKSKYSASINFSYYGSSLEKPFDNERPNVSGDSISSPVSARASVGVRYRINKNESIYLATGLSRDRPFENQDGDEWEASTPMIHYNNTFRAGDFQMNSTLMAYYNTLDYLEEINQVGTLAYALGTMSQLGQSRFEVGLGFSIHYTHFDGEVGSPKGTPMDVRPMQTDFGIGLTPRLQYRITDRFNLYTTASVLSYRHTRDRKDFDLEKLDVSQSLGAGIAIMRDFYLAPNIEFIPDDMRVDNTTVNLTAIVNVL